MKSGDVCNGYRISIGQWERMFGTCSLYDSKGTMVKGGVVQAKVYETCWAMPNGGCTGNTPKNLQKNSEAVGVVKKDVSKVAGITSADVSNAASRVAGKGRSIVTSTPPETGHITAARLMQMQNKSASVESPTLYEWVRNVLGSRGLKLSDITSPRHYVGNGVLDLGEQGRSLPELSNHKSMVHWEYVNVAVVNDGGKQFIELYLGNENLGIGIDEDCRYRFEVDNLAEFGKKICIFTDTDRPMWKYNASDIKDLAPEQVLVYDLETTSVSKEKGENEVLQLTITDGKGRVIIDELYKPSYTEHWDEAAAVNGITPEMVADKKHFEDDIDRIRGIFDGASAVIGYNHIGFDNIVLKNCYDIDPCDNKPQYDVMHEYGKFMGIYKRSSSTNSYTRLTYDIHKLGVCYIDMFGIDSTVYQNMLGAHNAAVDCNMTLALFEALTNPKGASKRYPDGITFSRKGNFDNSLWIEGMMRSGAALHDPDRVIEMWNEALFGCGADTTVDYAIVRDRMLKGTEKMKQALNTAASAIPSHDGELRKKITSAQGKLRNPLKYIQLDGLKLY